MSEDELLAGESVMNPSFEACCKSGKIKTDRPITPFPALLRSLSLGHDLRSVKILKDHSKPTTPRWRSRLASRKPITALERIRDTFRSVCRGPERSPHGIDSNAWQRWDTLRADLFLRRRGRRLLLATLITRAGSTK